jgi:hypothetical protein
VLRNVPSNAQHHFILSLGLEPVILQGYEAGKPYTAGSKKSKIRRDDQGSELTNFTTNTNINTSGVSRGCGQPRAEIYPSTHRRTQGPSNFPIDVDE